MRAFIDILEAASRPPVRLYEVVLYKPIETVLAPFLAEVTDAAVKQWFLTVFRNWAMKQPNELHKLTYVPPDANEKQKKAYSFQDLWDLRLTPATQTLITHFLDFFAAHPNLPRLDRMSVENVEQAAANWLQQMHNRAKREPDDPKQVVTVMTFPNGYSVVDLIGSKALRKEGEKMGHCVGGDNYCRAVEAGSAKIFSLRDRDGQPHATVELGVARNQVQQIKGKRNAAPVQRYWSMMRQFLDSIKAEIIYDYKNVGLLRITDGDTGESTTLTQEQFRDMVLDPDNEKGQRYLQSEQLRGMTDDELLGLFATFYGTERMTVPLVSRVFSRMASLAVQTVAHRGNLLTPAQVQAAFGGLAEQRDGDELKEFMRLTKPDVETAKAILQPVGQDRYRDRSIFMLALAQEMPATYRDLLGGDPALLQSELAQRGERAAAPFFVFAGTDELTPEMVDKAFAYSPGDAIKRIRKLQMPLTGADVIAALGSMMTTFYYGAADYKKPLDDLMAYAQPDATTLESVLSERLHVGGRRDFIKDLLAAAAKHVPDSLTQEVQEQALLKIDEESAYKQYFEREPKPSADFQKTLYVRQNPSLLHYVQVIDPALYKSAYTWLKPAGVDPMKSEQKHKRTKDGKYKNYTLKTKKTPDELAKEEVQAKRNAITQFTEHLDPLLREPDQGAHDQLEITAPKVLAAQHGFAAFGKTALLNIAIKYINRQATVATIGGSDRYGSNYHRPSVQAFAAQVATLPVKDIAKLINADQSRALFGSLIDDAPGRVVEVMKYWIAKKVGVGGYQRDQVTPWGDFKAKVDKEKAFTAIENVWGSDLPDAYKDGFAAVVLKRFKPSPAKLLTMLEAADNEEVTRKILQKTKNPSADLVDWVMESFPQLALQIQKIPPASLIKIFNNANFKYALALMNRDLRGYGANNTRSKWSSSSFHRKLDRQSEMFAMYASAAKAAGKTVEFERYAHQTELAERVLDTSPEEILAHLDEYSISTLVKIKDSALIKNPVALYFQRFGPNKLAALVQKGLFGQHYSYHNTPDISLKAVDPAKQIAVIHAILRTPDTGQGGLDRMVKIMLADKFPFDDALIIALLGYKRPVMADRSTLIGLLTTEEGKNWVADHFPYDMSDIRVPTSHMVKVLYDKMATGESYETKKLAPPYLFKSTIESWFKTDKHFGKVVANPVAAKLIKAEAARRGGRDLTITRMVFQSLAAEKNKPDPYAHLHAVNNANADALV
jgi:hypothetical protein